MDFISNFIKRPMSLVKSESNVTETRSSSSLTHLLNQKESTLTETNKMQDTCVLNTDSTIEELLIQINNNLKSGEQTDSEYVQSSSPSTIQKNHDVSTSKSIGAHLPPQPRPSIHENNVGTSPFAEEAAGSADSNIDPIAINTKLFHDLDCFEADLNKTDEKNEHDLNSDGDSPIQSEFTSIHQEKDLDPLSPSDANEADPLLLSDSEIFAECQTYQELITRHTNFTFDSTSEISESEIYGSALNSQNNTDVNAKDMMANKDVLDTTLENIADISDEIVTSTDNIPALIDKPEPMDVDFNLTVELTETRNEDRAINSPIDTNPVISFSTQSKHVTSSTVDINVNTSKANSPNALIFPVNYISDRSHFPKSPNKTIEKDTFLERSDYLENSISTHARGKSPSIQFNDNKISAKEYIEDTIHTDFPASDNIVLKEVKKRLTFTKVSSVNDDASDSPDVKLKNSEEDNIASKECENRRLTFTKVESLDDGSGDNINVQLKNSEENNLAPEESVNKRLILTKVTSPEDDASDNYNAIEQQNIKENLNCVEASSLCLEGGDQKSNENSNQVAEPEKIRLTGIDHYGSYNASYSEDNVSASIQSVSDSQRNHISEPTIPKNEHEEMDVDLSSPVAEPLQQNPLKAEAQLIDHKCSPLLKLSSPLTLSETSDTFKIPPPPIAMKSKICKDSNNLSAKEVTKSATKDEKDEVVNEASDSNAQNYNSMFFETNDAEFKDGNNIIFNPSDFDYLLSKGNDNVQVNRNSILLKFDPLLGVTVPVYQSPQQQQILQTLARNNSTAVSVSATIQEEDREGQIQINHADKKPETDEKKNTQSILTDGANSKEPKKLIPGQQFEAISREATKSAKNAKMSVEVITDMNIENDCNKTFENSNLLLEEKQKNFKMDDLEKKIKNEVLKTEDIEKKLKEAEQREEGFIKRITEKDKTISKMNGVIEAYERAIAELISEKEQLVQNYEKQMADIRADRDSNYNHLRSLETTFSDLHIKYEKSKEMTVELKASEEKLLTEKRQNLENLHSQEQRYEKMKNHAMQQLEIANKKLDTLSKEHAIETTKLKALLKKEEISKASINEQLQQKMRENVELAKICDELIIGQGS